MGKPRVIVTAVRPGDRVATEMDAGHFAGAIADDEGYLIDIERRTSVFVSKDELRLADIARAAPPAPAPRRGAKR